jgi:sugar lactone lactonase YvrE
LVAAAWGSSACVEVTTFAGNPSCEPPEVDLTPNCYADGTGGASGTAEFASPMGIAVDAKGIVYVADTTNNCIRRIDASGNVTTFAGNSMYADLSGSLSNAGGYKDGTGGPDGTAVFNAPTGLAVDQEGNVYVADTGNFRIRKIDPAGNVTTVAGNGGGTETDGTGGPDGTAEFATPVGVAVDAQGNVFVADFDGNDIRKIDPAGNVTTVAGNGMTGHVDGTGGASGTTEFFGPRGVAVDPQGTVYVADTGNNRIREIDPAGNVTTFAGNGTQAAPYAFADGTGGPHGTAEFYNPTSIAFDSKGNLYVADMENSRIRKVDSQGNVTTLAGNGIKAYADGSGGASGGAEFSEPEAVAVDSRFNVYVADTGNNRVREITQPGG